MKYACKYTPIEILAGFDIDAELLNPTAENYELSDQYIHSNVCSYSRSLIEESNSADILKDIKQDSPLVFYALLGCGIPNNTIDWIITDAIAITLKNIDKLSV
jgi:hypothetical protein